MKAAGGGWDNLRAGFATKSAATAWYENEYLPEQRRRRPLRGEMTVRDWRDLWLETSTVGESTKVWHEERTSVFVDGRPATDDRPAIDGYGDELITSIEPVTMLAWLASRRSDGPALSAMFAAAERANLLTDKSPMVGLVPRSPGRQIKPGWLIAEDVEELAQAALEMWGPVTGAVWAAWIYVAAYTGLRPGEVAGLREQDLDQPARGLLFVGQAANSRLRKMTLPKGGRTRHAVYPDIAREWVERMPRLHPTLLFVSPRKRIYYGSNRDRYWTSIRAAAGRPDLDLHELRHYAATYLIELGVSDSDAATQLGHVDGGGLVRRTYAHPRSDPALQRVASALGVATESNQQVGAIA